MPKRERQKLKLLALAALLRRETDDAHGLTVPEMVEHLQAQGISAERKSLYDDLVALEDFGMDIVRTRDRHTRYALANHAFELPELKLLVDAVQSSKFLSERKSRALIGKIEGLASRHEARELQRQVYVTHRVKSMNESVYYSIDALHDAMKRDRQITFRYFNWTVQKTQQLRHDGRTYCVSPFALVWDDEMYYLIAYDASACALRHYRVDKMQDIAVTEDARLGKAAFEQVDMAAYTQRTFGMFGGDTVEVQLLFANRLAGAVLDRFGKEVSFIPADDAHFRVRVEVVVSPQFMGFVAGFGSEARILGPQSVADAFVAHCTELLAGYAAGDGT